MDNNSTDNTQPPDLLSELITGVVDTIQTGVDQAVGTQSTDQITRLENKIDKLDNKLSKPNNIF